MDTRNGILMLAAAALTARAQTIALPAHPFGVAAMPDGGSVFVALMGPGIKGNAGIAVLKRGDAGLALSRVVALKSRPAGLVLTHDGKLLIAAAGSAVIFLDVPRMLSGTDDPVLGSFSDGAGALSIYANVTPDDKLLFVSDEHGMSITVADLERARGNGYKASSIIGKIPTAKDPIALTFSPDGKWLYTTSEIAPPDWKWPKACKPEGSNAANAEIKNPEGAVIVVDVARARTDPSQAVAARIPAGCSPVRMAISPAGNRIYVTARNSNAVLAFDTGKLLSDGAHARVGVATVGSSPVPVAVIDGGSKVIAGNSNRFGGAHAPQTLTVLDAAKMESGGDARLGTIPCGAFPREMAVSADGRILYVTNFGSNSLQAIDARR